MTILSTVLVLVLLGMYSFVVLHTNQLADILRQNLKIVVQLQDSLNQQQITQLEGELYNLEETLSGSIQFIPKAEALEIMQFELKDVQVEDENNPFQNMMTLKLTKDFISKSRIEAAIEKIKKLNGVEDASFYGSMYDFIGRNIRNLSLLLLLLGLVLSVFAFALIYSTIYLALYSERFKIRTMELVGATWRQVRKPFVEKSLRIATVSLVFSLIILLLTIGILYWKVELVREIMHFSYILVTFIMLIVVCFGITQLATFFVLKRYLGSTESKLHN